MNEILSPSQQAVVDYFPHFLMSGDRELTISGFAGSGKTFLVQYLVDISDSMQKFCNALDDETPYRKMFFTATTNKAAGVLQNMLGQETSTIHSLLGLKVKNNYKTGAQELVPTDKEENLTNSIVFIDEASMINRELLSIIRERAQKWTNTKLVYIGDKYQLPPVMEDVCPVFDDGPNTLTLTEIQRQVRGHPIIQLSAQYRACLDNHELEWPPIIGDGNHIIHYEDKMEYFDVIRNAYTRGHGRDDLKILAWSNPRVREYNNWIRRLEGRPVHYQPGELVITNKPLFLDKVIVAQTDSIHRIDNVWSATQQGVQGHLISLEGTGGDFFQPWDWTEADKLAKQLAADARNTRNWAPYFAIKEQWADLRPIHASTVHKAQGSTYREVFVDLNNIGRNNHWREVARLVYVAITRASERVHIYGQLQERYNRGPVIDLMEPFKNVNCL